MDKWDALREYLMGMLAVHRPHGHQGHSPIYYRIQRILDEMARLDREEKEVEGEPLCLSCARCYVSCPIESAQTVLSCAQYVEKEKP